MSITVQQLLQILPNASSRAGVFVPVLNVAMSKHAIVTKLRIAAFLAQVGHESGQLRYVRELGSDAYLEKYDTGRLAERLGNTPEDDGDGQLYRGRGSFKLPGGRTMRPAARHWAWICYSNLSSSSVRSMPPCRLLGSGTVLGSIPSQIEATS